MIRYFLVLMLSVSSLGCSINQSNSDFYINHNDKNLGEFSEFWSYCYSFYLLSEDNRWLLVIELPKTNGEINPGEFVKHIDLIHYQDKECEISLYKSSDIQCEADKSIIAHASEGEGLVRITSSSFSYTDWARVKLTSISFQHPDGKINIDEINIPKQEVSNFCAG